MRRRVPPLKTLEGFDAAARLGSFAAAAEAMGLTQSAISHQIRALENSLGQPLFRRLHRHIALTDAGEDFHRSVRGVLQGLRDAVERLAPYRKPNSVIIYCDSSFANAWLTPRLVELKKAHPDIDIWLDSSGARVELGRDEADIVVRRTSEGDDIDGESYNALFPLIYRPVASPMLAAAAKSNLAARHFPSVTALHLESGPTWLEWFSADPNPSEPLDPGKLIAGVNFSDACAMLFAAAHGLGVALAPTVFAAPLVSSGALTWIGERRLALEAAYVMSVDNRRGDPAKVEAVRLWIRQQALLTMPSAQADNRPPET